MLTSLIYMWFSRGDLIEVVNLNIDMEEHVTC